MTWRWALAVLWPLALSLSLGVVFGLLLPTRARRRLLELVVGDDGKLSITRVWGNVANAAATVLFLRVGWNAQPSEMSSMLFLIYLGVVGLQPAALRVIGWKWGQRNGNGQSVAKPAPAPARVS